MDDFLTEVQCEEVFDENMSLEEIFKDFEEPA